MPSAPDGMPPVRHSFCQAAWQSPVRVRAPGSAASGSSAELGELTVDFNGAERLGFLRVLLGWVLDRGVAPVRHADRVRLVRVEHEGRLRRDLVLPACPEVVLVPDLDPGPAGVTYPDTILVGRVLQGEERVAVRSSSYPEGVQVVAVPAEQDLDHLVQVAEG